MFHPSGEGIFSHKPEVRNRNDQLVMGLMSGMTQADGSQACDAPSLVPSPCHTSDLALGLNQASGMACVGDRTPLRWGWRQDGPGVRLLPTAVHLLPSCVVVQVGPDLLPVTAQPYEAKQGVRVFPVNAVL